VHVLIRINFTPYSNNITDSLVPQKLHNKQQIHHLHPNLFNTNVCLGVDHTACRTLAPSRRSVHLHSNSHYTQGPDFVHVPGNSCGTWQAFQLVWQKWPDDDELDVGEGVNTMKQNRMTLASKSRV
jgi:hypothetical protein